MLLIELMACKTIRKLSWILSGIKASIWPLNKFNAWKYLIYQILNFQFYRSIYIYLWCDKMNDKERVIGVEFLRCKEAHLYSQLNDVDSFDSLTWSATLLINTSLLWTFSWEIFLCLRTNDQIDPFLLASYKLRIIQDKDEIDRRKKLIDSSKHTHLLCALYRWSFN